MENKLKPFDLEKALAGSPVVTKGGFKVLEIYYFKHSKNIRPVLAVFENDEIIREFNKDGKYSDGTGHAFDLFMAPVKKEGWVNVYRDQNKILTGENVFNTEQEALVYVKKEYAGLIAVATIKIEWEE